MHSWQVKAIEESTEKADNQQTKFIKHAQVADWLNSWGQEDEKDPPK